MIGIIFDFFFKLQTVDLGNYSPKSPIPETVARYFSKKVNGKYITFLFTNFYYFRMKKINRDT